MSFYTFAFFLAFVLPQPVRVEGVKGTIISVFSSLHHPVRVVLSRREFIEDAQVGH